MAQAKEIQREKSMAALTSVIAAIGLTSMKLVVGLLTGSLGILAEAAHSGLDLVAALLTLFAVRIASRPADMTHHYGHGKVENLSAFLEAGLLLLTALWVIYEAVRRLLLHEGHVEVSIWAFVVMGVSIGIDFTRSRILLRVARKTGSQALEADALHFSTDIWSSSVVIAGLLIVWLVEYFHLPAWLGQADAVAALGVSAIVIWVSLQLAKETIDALLDRAPDAIVERVQAQVGALPDVLQVRRVRMRRAGNKLFADVIVAAPRTLTFEQTHQLTEQVERTAMTAVRAFSPQGDIDLIVHVEPTISPAETVAEQIHYLANAQGVHAHDIHVREVGGRLEVDFDLEIPADMNLANAHDIASHLEQTVSQENPRLERVTTHLEAPNEAVVRRQEVTEQYKPFVQDIQHIADAIIGAGKTHDVHIYRDGSRPQNLTRTDEEAIPEFDIVFHTAYNGQVPLSQAHIQAEEIKRELRQRYPSLGTITIHTEPAESVS